jgi:succinate dehydrogenase / fumarate reductase iron-sulfur subunit
MLQVKVHRYDPSARSSAHFDTFAVPVPKGAQWTVMDVLEYIRINLDSSIGYYAHSICDHGVCARCTLRVNGENRLACITEVPEGGETVLEPLAKRTVIKDLVVR